jgi:hypothetical protein
VAESRQTLTPGRQSAFPVGGTSGWNTPQTFELDEKIGVVQTAIEREEQGDKIFDPEKEGEAPPKRPFLLTHALLVGLAVVLAVVVEMACVAKVSLLARNSLNGALTLSSYSMSIAMMEMPSDLSW